MAKAEFSGAGQAHLAALDVTPLQPTIYDLEGFTVATPTNRYTLGDRSNLKPNADGSLDIYLQSESPGADKESNWLPTPAQPFSLHARLYSPRETAIDGSWAMPPVEKVK